MSVEDIPELYRINSTVCTLCLNTINKIHKVPPNDGSHDGDDGGSHDGGSPNEGSLEAHPNEAHPNEAHPNEAHPNEAHPNEAHPNEAHPSEAPPNEAPPNEAPPNEAPPSVSFLGGPGPCFYCKGPHILVFCPRIPPRLRGCCIRCWAPDHNVKECSRKGPLPQPSETS
ncbi:32247_t:CDS:1 [Racocetra persica]|uniref:32247_t:CDS:1 n=1 Tax=Racocetra persica TaxID=160502 RepID=A0ACA9R7P2_9GLOM|nr:32247_t:CDS:1 [Racocetra persica]